MSKNDTNQVISLELSDGSELSFNISRSDYIQFMNQANPKDRFNSIHNFLIRTVVEEDKPRLRELLLNPANTMELFDEVLEAYEPDVKVAVKKRKPSASK